MNIMTLVSSLTHLGATWVLWLLVLLSVAGLAIIVERTVMLLSSRDDQRTLSSKLTGFLASGNVRAARNLLMESSSYEARIARAGLDGTSAANAEMRMTGAALRAKLEMERYLGFLGTVGNNAPFVGLLGTVIGIIRAFHALDASSGQVSAALMSEVGEALGATAVGLLVALPAVAAFNLFQRIIKTRLSRADALGRTVMAHLDQND